jgi:DNA replication protein DnaC
MEHRTNSLKGRPVCLKDEIHTLNEHFQDRGICDLYLDTWFSNYRITNKKQQEVFSRVEHGYKKNKPMVLLGTYGGGKTHLATAMVKSKLYYGYDAWYYTLSDLFRDYRSCFQPKSDLTERQFFARIKTADLLVIDEINIRSDSEAENRFIQEVVDVRYANSLQTIFIANMGLEDFSGLIGARLVDRLKGQDAEILTFNWDSHRGKNILPEEK